MTRPFRAVSFLFIAVTLAAQPNPGSITTHRLPFDSPYLIDAVGNAYSYTGATNGATPGAAQTQNGGGNCSEVTPGGGINSTTCSDAFIAKVDPFGNAIFATLLGGPTNDIARA